MLEQPELFDCQKCPVADALEGLEDDNAEAWRMFQRLAGRFVVEMHLSPEVFRCYTAERSERELDDLLDRLELIYDVVMPVRKGET